MTKQDYELIARALRGHLTQWREDQNTDKANAVTSMAHRLADDFATQNPRFNRAIFLRACGVEQKPADAPTSLAPTRGCKRYGHHINPHTGRCNRCLAEG